MNADRLKTRGTVHPDQPVSRRRLLKAGAAGLAASPLLGAGRGRAPAAAQEATPAPDQAEAAPLPLTGERLAAFEAFVAAKLAELGIPGVAVAVVQGGAVAFLEGFGVRQLGQPAPVTADTLLRIGSVTKSFSSMLAAALVDAGRLEWETPLVDLLPTFAVADPALAPRLTIGDAFCACTGLPRRDLEYQLRAQQLTPELMIAGIAQLPLTAPFGEKFQYSNQMVAAGGFAAAVADGGSPTALGDAYALALRERILNPLGMERSTLDLAEVLADGDYATPHAADIAGALHSLPMMEDDTWVVPVTPAGGLWSSAREMTRYLQTELNRGLSPDGVRVVSAANLERTWRQGVALPSGPDPAPEFAAMFGGYGLGWFVGTSGGQRLIWHTGFVLGFTTLVSFLPEANLGIAILTNGSGTAEQFVYATQFRLLELLFDRPPTIDALLTTALAADAAGRAEAVAQLGQVDPAVATPFLGRYAHPALGDLTLAPRAGTLVLTVGGFRSELRPRLDADAAAPTFQPVDPPFASGLAPMTITLAPGADGQPRVVLTIKDDDGQDLVYPFEPVGEEAAPAP